MAITLKNRRVLAVAPETTRGTFLTSMDPTNDAVPLVREATFTVEPIRVDRPVLRLSLTDYPDIYPGVASVSIDTLIEISGVPPNTGTTTALASPIWTDLMRSCGFEEVSTATGKTPRMYTGFTTFTNTDGAPMRHGESVTVDYATPPDITGVVLGDTFFDDDAICIEEIVTSPGTGTITITTAAAGSNRSTTGVSVARDVSVVVGLRLRSNVNQMETISSELYIDGKRLRVKGCASNIELQLDHGDSLKARFTIQGVREAYADVALPATPNEQHYIPPTFLGKDVRFRTIESEATRKTYGRDGTISPSSAALNTLRFSTGNNVVLRQNSLDTNGVTFALITDREGTGSFNPDEVLESEFSFMEQFRQGKPIRFKGFIGANPAASPNAGDGNSIDIIAPGCVLSQLGDAERDLVNSWDGQFALTGGDYDTSASGELPGNDSELTIIYR